MSDSKEFFGKSVDDAIVEACKYFKCERDKLEIDIVEGGASGIFGLVGVKKAKIFAQKRDASQEEKKNDNKQPVSAKTEAPTSNGELEQVIRESVQSLLQYIIGEAEISIDMSEHPIKVDIEDEKNSGLIIGRDGQTLSSLQYMVNRIVAKKWPERVRIQLDTGDYREKQKDNLRSTAVYLAKKAKSSGKTQSTKPLTSYHRRVVHLALQDDNTIQTKSKGDGPLKRVLIFPKRSKNK